MSDFIHAPDFDGMPKDKLFTEYATLGGNPPGHIVVDKDGKHALLFDVGGVWISYPHKFQDLSYGGTINAEMSVRIEDPRWATLDVMGWNGDKLHHGFVRLSVWNGRIWVAIYNEWFECASNIKPLALMDCGAFNDAPHNFTVVIGKTSVWALFNDQQISATLTNPVKLGADSLRILARGMVQSTDPESTQEYQDHSSYSIRHWVGWRLKTETVHQFWNTIIRKLKVYGPAKS